MSSPHYVSSADLLRLREAFARRLGVTFSTLFVDGATWVDAYHPQRGAWSWERLGGIRLEPPTQTWLPALINA